MTQPTLTLKRRAARIGGAALLLATVLFSAVFVWLQQHFGYPEVLDQPAAEVLPRLLALGDTGRAVWLVYGLVPLLLLPTALGVRAVGRQAAPLAAACRSGGQPAGLRGAVAQRHRPGRSAGGAEQPGVAAVDAGARRSPAARRHRGHAAAPAAAALLSGLTAPARPAPQRVHHARAATACRARPPARSHHR